MFLKKIKEKLFSSDSRTTLIKKNIIGSFVLKLIVIALDFIIVPLTLSFLTQTNYGIWLTINSMIRWFNLFDLGISHGYRNKLSIALASNDLLLAKKLTSTAYIIISFLSLILIFLSIVIIPFVNWHWILNVDSLTNKELTVIVQIVLICFSFNLVFKILTSIFLAKQMPFNILLFEVIGKVIVFLGIFIIATFLKENLFFYVSIVSIIPVITLFIFNIFFFNKSYKPLKPSFNTFEKELIKDIMGLGINFFFIQLGATMLFMTDNIIIINLFSAEEVTPYEISKKYFSVLLVIFAIIIKPYWSAITEAYERNDFAWIKKSIKSLNKAWLLFALFSICMLIVFYPFLKLWIGDEVIVPLALAVQWSLFIILQTKNNIYTFFLNGTGKVKVQLITGLISFVVNIPLSILFAKNMGMGSAGVLLATNCSILFYIIIRQIQYKKIINKTAYGIWNK
jgi:O-antigen/teichoic acid export membrane protein